jgi:hypothetical protein
MDNFTFEKSEVVNDSHQDQYFIIKSLEFSKIFQKILIWLDDATNVNGKITIEYKIQKF